MIRIPQELKGLSSASITKSHKFSTANFKKILGGMPIAYSIYVRRANVQAVDVKFSQDLTHKNY